LAGWPCWPGAVVERKPYTTGLAAAGWAVIEPLIVAWIVGFGEHVTAWRISPKLRDLG
jgi:hypothetical protein